MTILMKDICFIRRNMFFLFAVFILYIGVECKAYSLTYDECLTFQRIITTLEYEELLNLSRDILQCYKEKNEEKLSMIGRDIGCFGLRKDFNKNSLLANFSSSKKYYHKNKSQPSRKLKIVYEFLVMAKNEVEVNNKYDYSKFLAPIFKRFICLLTNKEHSYWGFTKEIKRFCSTILSREELPPYSESTSADVRPELQVQPTAPPEKCEYYQNEALSMQSVVQRSLADLVMKESDDPTRITISREKTKESSISTTIEELNKLSVDSTTKRPLDVVVAVDSVCDKMDVEYNSSWMSWINSLKTNMADRDGFGLKAIFRLNSMHSCMPPSKQPEMEASLFFNSIDDNLFLPFMLGKKIPVNKENRYSLVPSCLHSVVEQGRCEDFDKDESDIYIQYIYLLLPTKTHFDISFKGQVTKGTESFYKSEGYSQIHLDTTLAIGGKSEKLNILFSNLGSKNPNFIFKASSPFIKDDCYESGHAFLSVNYNEELEEKMMAKTGACIFNSKHNFAAVSICWTISKKIDCDDSLYGCVNQSMIVSSGKRTVNYKNVVLPSDITKVDCSDNIIFIIYGFSIDSLSNNIPRGALEELVYFIKEQ